MGFKEDLAIDQFRLDYEWKRQASLFAEWGEKEAEAQFERDKLREKLDLTKAELDIAIRSNPTSFGLDKITEGAIQSKILQQPEYQEANEKYLQSVRDAKVMGVAKEAFEHRKKGLEKMTDLYLANYYAEPYIRKEAKEKIENESQKGAVQALNESMKSKNRLARRNTDQ